MSDARVKLMDAGERLFAQRGIDGVSLAEVTKAAGLGNTGAVHYYFGGREGLLEAIVDRRRVELDVRREERLDALDQAGATDLPSVVRALIEPLVDLLDFAGGRDFIAIQAQLALRSSAPDRSPRPLTVRVFHLLGMPGMRGRRGALRRDLNQMLVFNALAQRARIESAGDEPLLSRQIFLAELVGAATRVLDDRVPVA